MRKNLCAQRKERSTGKAGGEEVKLSTKIEK